VSPGREQAVAVRFAPTDTIAQIGTLSITSNDPAHATVQVMLMGKGEYAPIIGVVPDSLTVTLAQNDSTTRTLTIENTGMGSLIWSAEVQAQGMSPLYKNYLEKLRAVPLVVESKDQTVDNPGPPVEFSMGGPDSAGYRWIDSDQPGGPTFSWTDIQGVGTLISMSGDDANTGPFPIGFNFTLYGNTFSQFRICTNGWISFTSSSSSYSNYPLPSTSAPENLIAPFWDDLEFTSNKAYYYNDGTKLTIQFDAVRLLSNSSTSYTFQVILYSNGNIKLQYLTMVGPVNYCTVGIQNQPRTIGLTVVYNASYLHNNLAILISKSQNFLTLYPTNGAILSGQVQSINVKFSALGLQPGNHRSNIFITNNDPIHSVKSVPVQLTVDSTVTDVAENGQAIPKEFALHQNYPNPFNPSTTIRYVLPTRSRVKIEIYNILGQMIARLANSEQDAGYRSVVWNANVSTGIYFYRIEAIAANDPSKHYMDVKKMLLMK
jgi:hypothetical protein